MSLKPFVPQTDMKLEWEAPFYKRLPPDVDIMEGGNEYLILAKCGDELEKWGKLVEMTNLKAS